jgi:hypothetical protein
VREEQRREAKRIGRSGDGRGFLLGLSALLVLGGCLFGSRPGPRPDAPTESALITAPPPDVCKVTPGALRRIGPVEAGVTTFGQVLELLGRPPLAPGRQPACWLLPGAEGFALYAHGRIEDQPIRSLALANPDPDSAAACGSTTALGAPVAFESGLRPGMSRPEVEGLLGPVTVDEGGAFGKECCGLEQTGVGEKGPIYGFGCSAVLGTFRDGLLASVLVSRYAPPAPTTPPQ